MCTTEIIIKKAWLSHWKMRITKYCEGYSTSQVTRQPFLEWAIYLAVYWASEEGAIITKLTVNGKPYPREKITQAVNMFVYGALDCTLDRILEGVNN